MAKITVYNQEAKPLDGASVIVYDSSGKNIGGLATNKDGIGEISDSLLVDKGGKIVVSYVNHETSTTPISKFNGNVFLNEKGVTLGNVVIYSPKKKKPPTPIKIVNPYEQKKDDKASMTKRKSPVVPIVLGGLGLGALIFALSMKSN